MDTMNVPSPAHEVRIIADEILNVSEVAKDLRCSKAHVYKTINGSVAGVSPLPAIAHGRQRIVRRSALEEWKRANERR
jgi:excisionase family DNA binding protein